VARDPDRARRLRLERGERRAQPGEGWARIDVRLLERGHQGGDLRCRRAPGSRDPEPRLSRRGVDLDARAAHARRGLESTLAAAAQVVQHALDVLAGAQTVDREVVTGAGVLAGLEVADLDQIVGAAGRAHAEAAEMRLHTLQRLDLDDLALPAPATPLDLFLIAGLPALQRRRALNDPARLAACGPLRPGHAIASGHELYASRRLRELDRA